MLTDEVVKFFGTKADAARALNLTRGAITNWGKVVPESSVWRVEQATGGKLKGNLSFYSKLAGKRVKRRKAS
jgi:transcriptional repressor of cell division inhibition gene dicB